MFVVVTGDEVIVREGFIVLNPERDITGEGAMSKEDCKYVIALCCIARIWLVLPANFHLRAEKAPSPASFRGSFL